MARKKSPEEEIVEPSLCPTCGTLKVEEEGKEYCPNCDTAIDWNGDEGE